MHHFVVPLQETRFHGFAFDAPAHGASPGWGDERIFQKLSRTMYPAIYYLVSHGDCSHIGHFQRFVHYGTVLPD